MEYITLQEAIWKKINSTSTKKNTRALEKLYALSLCKIMEDKWNTFSDDDYIKKMETNLYYTKNPQTEVKAIPLDKATLFLKKYILKSHKKHVDMMNIERCNFYAKNPDFKRLSDEEIKEIQNESSESESETSEAESDEYN